MLKDQSRFWFAKKPKEFRNFTLNFCEFSESRGHNQTTNRILEGADTGTTSIGSRFAGPRPTGQRNFIASNFFFVEKKFFIKIFFYQQTSNEISLLRFALQQTRIRQSNQINQSNFFSVANDEMSQFVRSLEELKVGLEEFELLTAIVLFSRNFI